MNLVKVRTPVSLALAREIVRDYGAEVIGNGVRE